MKARQLALVLKFKGGRHCLVLRDHETGHISVFKGGEHVATAGPGRLIAVEQEAYLLSACDCYEFRGSWYAVARALSVLQQTGDWEEAYSEAEAVTEFEREFDL